MLPQATADLYRAGQQRVAETLYESRRVWDKARSPGQVDVDRLAMLLAASMVGAAADGAASVGAALAATGYPVDPVARIDPRAFALSASDGRPLRSLVTVPALVARAEGMDAGRVSLDRIVHTQVQDASRAASSVAVATRPKVGWIRFVNPPCCQDCAVQAGRWFRWNEGFERHPNCDCVHRPAHESEPPEGYTQDVDPDQIHDLTVGQRLALEDGGDLGQVVNSLRTDGWRKMSTAADYTTEGTTKRGWHSYVQRTMERQKGETLTWTAGAPQRRGAVEGYRIRRTAPRPTPDAIYRFSSSREEAIRLLHANGYVVGNLRDVARLAAAG